jgi:hypothetical protein
MEATDIKMLQEEAKATSESISKLLGSDAGFAKRRYSTETVDAFVGLLNEAADGNMRAEYALKEASHTADFPYLMGDVLDRSLMAEWATSMPNWQSFCKLGEVRDFREAKMLGIEGMGAVLDGVQERAEYAERGPSEETPITRQVAKYGAKFGLSFEAIINDYLGAFRDLPLKLVQAARRTEALAVTNLYCGSTGPDATLYSSGNTNIVTSNPALSIAGLATAFKIIGAQTDIDGFPLIIDAVTLVVPPALEITAQNILNATELRVATGGGAYNAADQLVVRNWMNGRLSLTVDPFIGMVATSNQATSWFLFASVSAARPALQVDYLRGHGAPELFVKAPNASRVGGGSVPESFENDEVEYKVRHIFGGTVIAPKATVASNG